MSNCEHLIENALYCMLRTDSFEDAEVAFNKQTVNKDMLKVSGIKLTTEQIMEMAQYVLYSFLDYDELEAKKEEARRPW